MTKKEFNVQKAVGTLPTDSEFKYCLNCHKHTIHHTTFNIEEKRAKMMHNGKTVYQSTGIFYKKYICTACRAYTTVKTKVK